MKIEKYRKLGIRFIGVLLAGGLLIFGAGCSDENASNTTIGELGTDAPNYEKIASQVTWKCPNCNHVNYGGSQYCAICHEEKPEG